MVMGQQPKTKQPRKPIAIDCRQAVRPGNGNRNGAEDGRARELDDRSATCICKTENKYPFLLPQLSTPLFVLAENRHQIAKISSSEEGLENPPSPRY